jgi:hypothetical protein
MKDRAAAFGVLAVLLASSAPADASKVKGRIENWRSLTNPVWNEAKDPKKHGYSFRESVTTVRSDFRRLFPHIPKELCVAAISGQKQKPVPPVLIRVGGGRTTPVTIVVPPGTQLQFKNTDPFKHRLFVPGNASFAANDTIKGGIRGWTVPGAGVYEIRDELAPSLRMFVVAEANVAAMAYPSMKGEFVLNVPETGEYTIQAYFSGKKVGPAKQVKLTGDEVDLSKDPIKVADDKKKDDDDEGKGKDKDKDKDEKGKDEKKEEKK